MTTNFVDESPSSLKEFQTLLQISYESISDFDKTITTYDAAPQHNKILQKLKQQEHLFRVNLFSEYYNISEEEIEALIKIPPSQRAQLCSEKGVNRYILRTLFDYNRYVGCYFLHNFLFNRFGFENKNLLDFGCLVSDYGFYFGMLNMKITLCDFKEYVDFADFRLSKANISTVKFYAPADYKEVTKNQDIAVFGEVLEHLKDPYLLLESCVQNRVRYILTTCYPYGDDQYFNYSGHRKEAQEQAPDCFHLLSENYMEIRFINHMTVWVNEEF